MRNFLITLPNSHTAFSSRLSRSDLLLRTVSEHSLMRAAHSIICDNKDCPGVIYLHETILCAAVKGLLQIFDDASKS